MTISRLLTDLRDADTALKIAETDADIDAVLNRHWEARASLASTPATSMDDIRAKAEALAFEIARTTGADGSAACWQHDAPGCARELAESLARDALAMGSAR